MVGLLSDLSLQAFSDIPLNVASGLSCSSANDKQLVQQTTRIVQSEATDYRGFVQLCPQTAEQTNRPR
jgi:shikimate kinase